MAIAIIKVDYISYSSEKNGRNIIKKTCEYITFIQNYVSQIRNTFFSFPIMALPFSFIFKLYSLLTDHFIGIIKKAIIAMYACVAMADGVLWCGVMMYAKCMRYFDRGEKKKYKHIPLARYLWVVFWCPSIPFLEENKPCAVLKCTLCCLIRLKLDYLMA